MLKRKLCQLALAAGTFFAAGAQATAIPVDLNSFFSWDPEVTVSANGTVADFVESAFISFVRLTNDPFLGDPEVIVAGSGLLLNFDFDFFEASDGDDVFAARLFDADLGVFFGALDLFEVSQTAAGTASFDLTPYIGRRLGLEFELRDRDLFGTRTSTARVSNLALATSPSPGTVSEPTTALLCIGALAVLGLARRRLPLSSPGRAG